MYGLCGILLLCTLFIGLTTAELPDYIQVCHLSDPKIEECMIDTVEKLKPKLRSGIPELNVPSIEPLEIANVTLTTRPDGTVESYLYDLKAFNLTGFKVETLKFNKKKNTFRFNGIVPHFGIVGKYKLNWKVLFLNVRGVGEIRGHLDNFKFEAIIKNAKVKRDGKYYLQTTSLQYDFIIDKAYFELDNLFDGDKMLGELGNQIINENVHVLVNDIKPGLRSSLTEEFRALSANILSSAPYEELFPQ